MRLSKIAAILNTKLIGDDGEFTTINIDSRTLKQGELFIALKGENFDGHDFVLQAQQQGAVGAVVDHHVGAQKFAPVQNLVPAMCIPQIIVPNTIEALGQLGKWRRSTIDFPLVVVTGSSGKTTTRAIIASILSEVGPVLSSTKSFNNEIGVPLTLWQLSTKYNYGVLEIGANHFGEITPLVNIVRPQIAVITNAGPAHLEGFNSIDGVACAKGEILRGLTNDGIAVLNADDKYFPYWQHLARPHRVVTFGMKNEADIMLTDLCLNEEHQASFNLVLPETFIPINLPLLGAHNVLNALAAAAVAYTLEVDIQAIKAGLEKVKAVDKRLKIYNGFAGAKIIDDSYNAIPTAVIAALEILARVTHKKIFVFGEMRELGTEVVYWHEQIGKLARDLNIDLLYAYGKNAPIVAEAFGANAYAFTDHDELVAALKPQLDEQTTVLVKGSRGSTMERVVEQIKAMNNEQ